MSPCVNACVVNFMALIRSVVTCGVCLPVVCVEKQQLACLPACMLALYVAGITFVNDLTTALKQQRGSSSSISGRPTLGFCLLSGLSDITQQQAKQLYQQWQSTAASLPSWQKGGVDARLALLQDLAPGWPPQFDLKPNPGLDRVRGLLQLATAAAMCDKPVEDVVQVCAVGAGRSCCF